MVAFRHSEIRIIDIPPGEAPEAIRAEWVGLVLPLAMGHLAASEANTVGVISGEHEAPMRGYSVDIEEAISALAKKSPEAAAWWRESVPHLFYEGSTLIFHEQVCEPL